MAKQSIPEMDKESRERFEKIVAHEAAALTPGDLAFLRARSSYLSADQKKVFAKALKDAEEAATGKGPADDEDEEEKDTTDDDAAESSDNEKDSSQSDDSSDESDEE